MRRTLPAAVLAAMCAIAPAQDRSAEDYAGRVAALLDDEREELLRTCRTGDLSEIYFASYVLDGLLAAAEATGREEFLIPAVEAIDAIIAAGQDRNGDGYIDFFHSVDKAWDTSEEGISSSTMFKGLRPIPRAARVILRRFARKPYLERAQKLIRFIEKHILEKWQKKGVLASWRQISLCIMLVDIYLLTGKEEHRKLVEQKAREWKDHMVLVDGAYVWNAGVGGPREIDRERLQDTSHANTVLAFTTLCCRAGIVFTEEDMQRYCRTFTKNVWRGPDKPAAGYVDGSGATEGTGPSLSDGWVKLGLFSPDVQKLLAQRTRVGSQATEYWGNMALNAALAGSRKTWSLSPVRRPGGAGGEKKEPPKGSVSEDGPWVPPQDPPKESD